MVRLNVVTGQNKVVTIHRCCFRPISSDLALIRAATPATVVVTDCDLRPVEEVYITFNDFRVSMAKVCSNEADATTQSL